MNIVLARTFLEIVECGNLKKAAERLCVTQSTVTTQDIISTMWKQVFNVKKILPLRCQCRSFARLAFPMT